MLSQGKVEFARVIESVLSRFCNRLRLRRNMIAAEIGVENKSFYDMLEGRKYWTHRELVSLYEYVKSRSRQFAAELAQAILNDPELHLTTEEQLLKDQVFALLTRAGQAFDDGVVDKTGLLNLSNEAIELATKLKVKAKER